MTERRLDEAIDRAVRDMMDVDPRPGLTRRVLARLDEPLRGSLTVPVRRLAVAAAALAVVAIAAALLVNRTPAPIGPRVSSVQDTALAAQPAARVLPPTPRKTRTPAGRPVTISGELPPFAHNVHVTPLADIAPIVVGPTGPRALDAPEVLVLPLAPIEPVRIDPLSSTPH
jgi:hypothetical protein